MKTYLLSKSDTVKLLKLLAKSKPKNLEGFQRKVALVAKSALHHLIKQD